MTLADPPPPFVLSPGPYAYEPRLPVPTPTPVDVCDTAVAELRGAADRWARADPARVRDLLDETIRTTVPLIGRWTELGAIHEGVDPRGPDAAEEAIAGPYVVLRSLRLHRDAVADIAHDGWPRIP